jgi:hypothetical protein
MRSTLLPTDFKPSVIAHLLRKVVAFAMVPFDRKWRLYMSKGFWEALAKIAVEIKC